MAINMDEENEENSIIMKFIEEHKKSRKRGKGSNLVKSKYFCPICKFLLYIELRDGDYICPKCRHTFHIMESKKNE